MLWKCGPLLTVNFSLLLFLLANDDDDEDEQDGECQQQITNIRRYVCTYYAELTKCLPTDDLLLHFYSKEVITNEQKEDIQNKQSKNVDDVDMAKCSGEQVVQGKLYNICTCKYIAILTYKILEGK